LITQVPGGWLSGRYGGKKVIVVSNIVASILTVVTPFSARWHWTALCLIRFLIGLAHVSFFF